MSETAPVLPAIFLVLPLLVASPAQAGEVSPADAASARRAANQERRRQRQHDPNRLEPGLFPGAAYDSNLGFGTGIVGNLARLDAEIDPYRWRLAAQVFLYIDQSAAGGPEITFVHNYADLDVPGLLGGRLRVRARLFFRRQVDTGWYGLGNASTAQEPWLGLPEGGDAYVQARRFQEYEAMEASARGIARLALGQGLEAFAGLSLTWVWPTVYEGSRLAQDLAGASGELTRRALVGARRHGVLKAVGGVVLDTRDSETDPERGVFGEASLRGGPVFEANAGYLGLDAHWRVFLPMVPYYLTVGIRGLADVLFGDPPFYELGRADGLAPLEALSGQLALRGMPARRYHGKVKLLGTLEARMRFFSLRVFGQKTTIGAVAFADLGRVWADTSPHPELDGRGPGAKIGVGTGLRIRFGTTLMVRIDAAWTPDGTGLYADVEHAF